MSFCELPLDLLTQPVEAWAQRYFSPLTSGYGSRASRAAFENSCEALDDYEGDLPEPPLFVLLTRIAELHERYAEWTPRFTAEQLSQGLWWMFSFPGYFGYALHDKRAPVELRERAMRSLVTPYRVYVRGWNPHEAMPHGWDMLWDLALDGLHPPQDLANVALECLKEILRIPDVRCQAAALHGLNHLGHPDRPAVVQRWMDEHRGEEWDWDWVADCRDGRAM